MLASINSIPYLAMPNPEGMTPQNGANQAKLAALEAFAEKYKPQTNLDQALYEFLKNIYQRGTRCIRSKDDSALRVYEYFTSLYKRKATHILIKATVEQNLCREIAEEASHEIWRYFLKKCHQPDFPDFNRIQQSGKGFSGLTAIITDLTLKRLVGWLQDGLARIYGTPTSLDQMIGESDEPLINTIADPNSEVNPGFPTLSDLDNLPLEATGFQPSSEIDAETQALIDLIKDRIDDRVVTRDGVSISVIEIASVTIFQELQSLDSEDIAVIAQRLGIRERGIYSIINDEIRPILIDIICEQILVPGKDSRTAWVREAIRADKDGKLRKRRHPKSELCNLQFLALRRLPMCCDPPQSFEDISRALQEQGCSLKAKQIQTFWEARDTRRSLYYFLAEHLFRPPTLRQYLHRDPEAELRNLYLPKRTEINAQFLAIERIVYRNSFEQIYKSLAAVFPAYHTYGQIRRTELIERMENFWQKECVPLIRVICQENNYQYPEDL